MHLKSLTLEGFKSFPKRTRLEFAEGISVVIGPNGSGKSNIIDAVLWVLGEQSPLTIRGQTMQDVIFGGGHGHRAGSFAEVEIVIDNSDGAVDLPFGEVAISRRLTREGEGEYRLNGARARLVDVLELLGTAGLGKEMHSVISQGRVDSIVTSKPKDRRLLLEEAAGLGKHRKRKRRAQLKIDRTKLNLERVADVEREARTRLKPLKRQAQAAEIHARLERQIVETQLQLTEDELAHKHAAEQQLRTQLGAMKQGHVQISEQLQAVAQLRSQAEERLTTQNRQRDELTRSAYGAQNLLERLANQRERLRGSQRNVQERLHRLGNEVGTLKEQTIADQDQGVGGKKIISLEEELAEVDRLAADALTNELQDLHIQVEKIRERLHEGEKQVAACTSKRDQAKEYAEKVRSVHDELVRDHDRQRRATATLNAELAAVNQFLRSFQLRSSESTRTLATALTVQAGYEQAFAAALGSRLTAQVTDDPTAALIVVDAAGENGGSVLLLDGVDIERTVVKPPTGNAQPLADYLQGDDEFHQSVRQILMNVWLVEEITAAEIGVDAVLVTREGRVWDTHTMELRQIGKEASEERILAKRNKQQQLIADIESAVQCEQDFQQRISESGETVASAEKSYEEQETLLRTARHRLVDIREEDKITQRTIERRRASPQDGPLAVRRAQLVGELAAEQRALERAQRELQQRQERLQLLVLRCDAYQAVLPKLEQTIELVHRFHGLADRYAQRMKEELAQERSRDDALAQELRTHAAHEADLQRKAQSQSEQLTRTEVELQHSIDMLQTVVAAQNELAEKLGVEVRKVDELEPVTAESKVELSKRLERLVRRREQLGPINPLAEEEYKTACEHVEDLERQRNDLETALREIQNLMRETDRYIKETFELTFQRAADNFQGLLSHLFPGGKGRLRLVDERQNSDVDETKDTSSWEAENSPHYGVEIEIMPAGKQMKQLTLLSGGEKALTAIAFLFSVFLAQPCPFYILDEVEAALDDVNAERFVDLLGQYAHRAQFVVVTHRKQTMDVADALYGVSMAGNGISNVVSRRLPSKTQQQQRLVGNP